jgi:lipopolysaccharide transport system ATP-binding protein
MSLSISVENVSKVYRLGEINRGQFFGDVRRWVRGKFNPDHTFGDPETEAEQDPKAADLFYALKNVSFDIKQGETVGIIGANGAGKSTLLKLISRITSPSAGSIKINGRIGSLLEVGTGFHPDLTGRDNVFMNGAILGMNRTEVAAKFDDIVSFSGVEKFIDTPVKRYSSGMFVRLAFSVAAFLEPEILIVDEVLSVGDQQFQNRCMQRLKEIIKDGRTVLFVSHGAGQVRELCSRAICLKSGEIICDDEPSKALEFYQEAVRDDGVSQDVTALYSLVDEVTFKSNNTNKEEIVRIISAKQFNEAGESIKKIKTSDNFYVEFNYEVLSNEYALRPACTICDDRGNVIFWTADSSNVISINKSKKGIYKTVFKLPARLFSPVKLLFNLEVIDAGIIAISMARAANALSIMVEDDLEDHIVRGLYQGIIPGAVRPAIEWKTQ